MGHHDYLEICGLDSKDMKNSRPIPNLPVISKLIEKVAARYPEEHSKHNGLNGSYQSVYRSRCYSTETDLLKVPNDIAVVIEEFCLVYLQFLK